MLKIPKFINKKIDINFLPETLFTANRQSSSVHQVSEIFPTSRNFKHLFAQLSSYPKNGKKKKKFEYFQGYH